MGLGNYNMRNIALLFIIFTIGFLIFSSGSPTKEQEGKTDLEKLQGTWQLVSGAVDCKELPHEEVKNTKIVIKDDTFVFLNASRVGTSPKGTFEINLNSNPKEIDSTATDGPNAGQVSLGIYEVEENHQKTCFSPS